MKHIVLLNGVLSAPIIVMSGVLGMFNEALAPL